MNAFRKAMGFFPTGVTIITVACDDGTMHGVTVNSFSSVSLDPMLVLVCINGTSRAVDLIEGAGAFIVNVLSAGQQDVSRWFANPMPLVPVWNKASRPCSAHAAKTGQNCGSAGPNACRDGWNFTPRRPSRAMFATSATGGRALVRVDGAQAGEDARVVPAGGRDGLVRDAGAAGRGLGVPGQQDRHQAEPAVTGR